MSDLLRFLLQTIVIIGLSRAAAAILAAAGQPAVIGEILAGILLGPAVLGRLAPETWALLFPSHTFPVLSIVSQFGLILFIFLVGLRVDLTEIRNHRSSAASVSAASIVVPFACGAVLASFIQDRLAPPEVSGLVFALFVGTAMSVTAFPVLARILSDTGLIDTRLG